MFRKDVVQNLDEASILFETARCRRYFGGCADSQILVGRGGIEVSQDIAGWVGGIGEDFLVAPSCQSRSIGPLLPMRRTMCGLEDRVDTLLVAKRLNARTGRILEGSNIVPILVWF